MDSLVDSDSDKGYFEEELGMDSAAVDFEIDSVVAVGCTDFVAVEEEGKGCCTFACTDFALDCCTEVFVVGMEGTW